MDDYLPAECELQAILPMENKEEFAAKFLSAESYLHRNSITDTFFRNGYAYHIDAEDNEHGLSAVKIYFKAEFGLNDYFLTPNSEVFQSVCKDLKIKRLLAYGKNDDDGFEETLQYDNKGVFNYESRDLYPDPFFDCSLGYNEKFTDETECMG